MDELIARIKAIAKRYNLEKIKVKDVEIDID
jgi:DNA-binding response OmpR family regulator